MGTSRRPLVRFALSPLIVGFALSVAFTAWLCPTARAAAYHVYGCQHPDASPAPADGWLGYTMVYTQSTLCSGRLPSTATILAIPVPDWTHSELIWRHSNGAAVELIAARIRRSVTLPASPPSGSFAYRLYTGIWAYGPEDLRDSCSTSAGCTTIAESDVSVAGLHGGDVWLLVQCDGGCVPGTTTRPNVVVTRSDLTFADDVTPEVSNIGGSLASGRAVWGVADLTYRATDVGAGVYLQKLVIDGKTVAEEVADSNGGKCRDVMPGWGTPYEFDYTIPCAARVDGRIVVDLNAISTGPHEISAGVEDAAGNARTIFSGHIDVLSDPAHRAFDTQGVVGMSNPLGDRPGLVANGTGASRDAILAAHVRAARGLRRSATVTYPAAPRLVVRLTAGGKPVSGAVVSVLEREAGSVTWRATKIATTSQVGDASVRLDSGPSRAVRLAYAPDSESTTFVSSPTLSVRVKPRVTLRANPRRRRTGQRVRFSGRVVGGAIPATGLALGLQAEGPDGRWLTFKTIRTNAGGRFHARYRFTSTTGNVRYRFRVRVLRQGGYPFAATHSRPASVRVEG
jgi:hypothetical protein